MKLNKIELIRYQKFAEITALAAGKILSAGFNKSKKIDYKGIIDPVTEYDLKSEKLIISRITKTYPDHDILSEESQPRETDADFRWVIDPLDGTVNYTHRMPIYSVSIALQFQGQSVIGVVYDPENKELYSAAFGCGAYLNNKKIKVSTETKLERALLATGFAYNIHNARKNNLGMFSRMIKQAQAIRRLGSAALDLCWLATGRFDGFWEYYLHPWDTAAAMLIVTEAGGVVTKIDSSKYSIFDNEILAANNKNIQRAMKKVLTLTMKKR
ncbi:inositol monophosphatase family protein [Candidatus Zixiibacteriota bacterium]